MSKRVLIVAGETSGDVQAARLVRAMARRNPELRFSGAGGPELRAAGCDTFVDISELSVMGFSEVVSGIRRIRSCYKRLKQALSGPDRPDMLILVDFPDFNLLLAGAARKLGVRVFYYISPQVWAWRTSRIRKIARCVDRMVVLFPFEEELFRERGVDAHFVGHPLAEDVAADCTREETFNRYRLDPHVPVIALLPGSRRKEVESGLPAMLEGMAMLSGRVQPIIARAPGMDAQVIDHLLAESRLGAAGVRVPVAEADTWNVVSAADAAVVTSGTATVETAVLGCPMVVFYRMSKVTYALARRLVRVDHIAMPNIVLGRRVVPELVQDEATPEAVAREIGRYIADDELRKRVGEELSEVRNRLVRPGAADRAAELALETLGLGGSAAAAEGAAG